MANQYQIANLPTLLEKVCNSFSIFFFLLRIQNHIYFFKNKMTSVDKDFRFMATNDLMTELQNDSIKLDDDSERKVNDLRQVLTIDLRLELKKLSRL